MRNVICVLLLSFFADVSVFAQGASQPEEYTYVMQSEDKEITAKMVNDELEGTGVKVHFYDRAGKLIGRWEISNTSSESWGLSPKGNYFMCRVVRRSEPGVAGNSEVVVIDKTGKELFSYGIGEIGRWSPNEDYFVVRDYAVRAYDLKGKVLWERKKSPGASEISLGAISNNGRYIVLADSPKRILLLDQSGKELYVKDFEIIPGKLKFSNIWGIAVDNNGNVLLRPGAASEIRVVDTAGNIKLARHFAGYKKFDVAFSTSNTAAIEIVNRENKEEKTSILWDTMYELPGVTQPATTVKVRPIPESVSQWVAKNKPAYTIPKLEQFYDASFREVDLSSYLLKNDGWPPYCAAGDFNGDKKTDYALILSKPGKGKSWNYVIVILHASKAGFYEVESPIKHSMGSGDGSIGTRLSVLKRGKHRGGTGNTEREVVLKRDSILLSEGFSTQYFILNNGHYTMHSLYAD